MVKMLSGAELYEQYKLLMQRIADVRYASAVLQWDQETYMPVKGAEGRARQLATLTEMAHNLYTDGALENILTEIIDKTDIDDVSLANVQLTLDELNRQKKLNSTFVRTLSETVSKAFNAWIDARKKNDFTLFQASLAELVTLKITEADLYGYDAHPYDALLYEFEKSMTVQKLDTLFDVMTEPLKEIIATCTNKNTDDSFLHQYYPKDKQWEWGMFLVRELGFDLAAGRQDISEHPFTTNFNAQDVRITTRIDEHDFANMTWSCIHETGHALYEQGLPSDAYGLPAGEFASLSIHESQSRLWENCVGRSKIFWQHYLPVLKKYFPSQLEQVDIPTFYQGINRVQPSFIRTEADELTYHFHVKIRYEIEKALISKSLSVKDLPVAWNDLYKKHLGVIVPDDNKGCLQDVHWSHGSFGYFPTYSLGSFYAAQFWAQAKTDIPGLEAQIAGGDTKQLLLWLREKIHRHGKLYDSEALCKSVTGKGLDTTLFINYAKEKYL